VIPVYKTVPSYFGNYLNPYAAPFAPSGVASTQELYKFQKILDRPLNTEQFLALQAQWRIDREAALKAAAGN